MSTSEKRVTKLSKPPTTRRARPIVVTGGSGFIGSNLADSLLRDGEEVIVFDNLSREGVEQNLQWLSDGHGARIHPIIADVRDFSAISSAIKDAKAVFHMAAQTAVTTSLVDPLDDFSVNAQGTLNVLEAVRRTDRMVPVIFASTNKVYGGLEDIPLDRVGDRYLPRDKALQEFGVSESRKLDFCTPYGCSKGVADQYVLDYSSSYGLPTAVLRMSCIYGPRQFGTEDQGWVAHFLIRAMEGEPITVYGDGKQVRDILHVYDAVAAYRGLLANIARLSGRAFNLGGGPKNAVSLQILIREIERVLDCTVTLEHDDWREGDQLYFVADTRALKSVLDWAPRLTWREGLRDLTDWLATSRFSKVQARRRASA